MMPALTYTLLLPLTFMQLAVLTSGVPRPAVPAYLVPQGKYTLSSQFSAPGYQCPQHINHDYVTTLSAGAFRAAILRLVAGGSCGRSILPVTLERFSMTQIWRRYVQTVKYESVLTTTMPFMKTLHFCGALHGVYEQCAQATHITVLYGAGRREKRCNTLIMASVGRVCLYSMKIGIDVDTVLRQEGTDEDLLAPSEVVSAVPLPSRSPTTTPSVSRLPSQSTTRSASAVVSPVVGGSAQNVSQAPTTLPKPSDLPEGSMGVPDSREKPSQIHSAIPSTCVTPSASNSAYAAASSRIITVALASKSAVASASQVASSRHPLSPTGETSTPTISEVVLSPLPQSNASSGQGISTPKPHESMPGTSSPSPRFLLQPGSVSASTVRITPKATRSPHERTTPEQSTLPVPSPQDTSQMPILTVSPNLEPTNSPLATLHPQATLPAPSKSSPVVTIGTQSTVPSSDSTCFPAFAIVNLWDGTTKAMHDLVVGDRVQVGMGLMSEVYGFSHFDPEARAVFSKLHTMNGTLTLTPTHHVLTEEGFIAAAQVKVGNSLVLAQGLRTRVQRVTTVISTGLYNPHTIDGKIVVDGFVTSTYTLAVEAQIAHSLLAPLRLLHMSPMRCDSLSWLLYEAQLSAIPQRWKNIHERAQGLLAALRS